jgi:hypothetical protein
LAASRCYSIYNLLWHDAKERFWNALHVEYAEILDWHLRAKGDFERYDVCDFVMNVVLYDHAIHLRRVERGTKLKHENFLSLAKAKQLSKKIGAFFNRFFSRKKKED